MAEEKSLRDIKFDALRTIGLLAIILAHVNPPSLLFQLRNFDVPLMVLVSGAVYGLSGTKKKYMSYIGGRIVRLLAPTWAFLCIFFLFSLWTGKNFSQDTIVSSFALLNGIGYVWIIRVFILVAILAPFFVYLYEKIRNKNFYLLVLLGVFVFYNLLLHGYQSFPLFQKAILLDFFMQNIFFYILPFGVIAGLGLYLLHTSKRAIFILFVIFSLMFGTLAYKYSTHGFMQTQAYKYPPGGYYLAYALAASLALYLLSYTKVFESLFRLRLMQFIASSTLWIYLWQILFLYQWDSVQKYLPSTFHNFISEYIGIILLSTFMTFGQKLLIGKVVKRIHNKAVISALKTVFLK